MPTSYHREPESQEEGFRQFRTARGGEGYAPWQLKPGTCHVLTKDIDKGKLQAAAVRTQISINSMYAKYMCNW